MPDAGGFCTLCGFAFASFEGLTQCPNCGTTAKPCAHADALTIAINRHELHVLCVWAERWGMQRAQLGNGGPGTVYAIVSRLKARHPALAAVPLTLVDEVQGLRDAGYQVTSRIPGIESDRPGAPRNCRPGCCDDPAGCSSGGHCGCHTPPAGGS